MHSAHLRFSPDAAVVPPEGHNLLLGYDVIEVAHGLPEVHVLDGMGRLARVLEMHAQVKAPRLACCEWGNTHTADYSPAVCGRRMAHIWPRFRAP